LGPLAEVCDERATSLELMLSPQLQGRPRSGPDWWRDYSKSELPLDEPMLDRESMHLMLQEDRTDGPNMPTLRYPFSSCARLRGRRSRAGTDFRLSDSLFVGPTCICPILPTVRACC